MPRFIASVAVVALSVAHLASPALAQEGRPSQQRPLSLSERLEIFRTDLLGGEPNPTPQQRKAQQQKGAQAAGQKSAQSSNGSNQKKPTVAKSSTDDSDLQPSTARVGSRLSEQAAAKKQMPSIYAGGQVKPSQQMQQTIEPQPKSSRRTAQPDYASKREEPTRANEPTPAAKPTPAKPTIAKSKPQPAADSSDDEPGQSLQDKLANVRRSSEKERNAEPTEKKPSPWELQAPRVARAERIGGERSESPRHAEPAEEETTSAPQEETPVRSQMRHNSGENVLFSSQSAVLSVETAGPRKVMIGKEATFNIKIRNSGEVAANNVVVSVNIPEFAEVASAQPSTGSGHQPSGANKGEAFEWKISRLEAHGRESLTLKIVPHKSLPLDLGVQWTCSPESTQTLVEVQEPKLMLALSGPDEVLFGQSKIYKLALSNPGNGDAENVLVSLLPIGRGGEAAASHRLGTIKAGESKAIEVELTARQAGSVTIKAQAFADGGLRAEVAEQVLVRRANLKVEVVGSKVKYAGTPSTYQVRVQNTGNAPADKVQVSAMLPPEAKYISSNGGGRLEADQAKVVWPAGSMQPGSERTFELVCSLNAPGENRMQILAVADRDLTGTATSTTRVDAIADLKLEVRDPQGPVPVGEDTVYEVVIRNRGTKAAEGVELVTFFSEGLEATSVQGGAHEISRGQVVFKPILTISPGSETTIRIHTKADRGGNHVFRAEVICPSLHTKLAAEETTHFYGEETASDEAPAPARTTKAKRMRVSTN